MKGKIECTIPQRQFENIKTSYEFSNEEERELAVKMIIKDCLDLKDIVPKTEKSQLKPEKEEVLRKWLVKGVIYREISNSKGSIIQYFDKISNKWIRKDK